MTIDLNDPDSVIDWLCDGHDPTLAPISIAKLSALVSKALTMDGLDHDANVVLGILIAPLGDYEEMVSRADTAITAGDIYLHGSDWMVGIAEHFGYRGEADGFISTDWLEDRPYMRAVYRALTMLSVGAMSAASAVYEAQHGHSMLEVFLASAETGEDFDQTQARLTAQRRGLQLVK